MDNQNDRVSYSFGMKVSLPTKYESADFHVSLSSEVRSDETSVQAFNRVKKEVEVYAQLAYEQIRNSESGLTNEAKTNNVTIEQGNKRDVSPPAAAKEQTPVSDTKILKQKIKNVFGVLEAQKKITKSEFVTKYLKNKKTDDLSDLEVTRVIVDLRENFPEIKI